ncbi:E3 ubiquitin-protein ligase RNF123-like isoform X1 [Pomacea canaliculata]|uniref:E3 ubiquitin-protein ligase RNF123-like isoform X1 n=1 Tax=Pomacea canaliculata TaxID=400727 RepID=UPI000D733334|nr:E3 ubiquitin-protein ligase RNF123-like isoform X1 [Pomacea canaliculata]
MEEHVSSNISSRSSNEEDSGRIGPPDVILDILSNVGTLIVEPDRLGVASHSNFSTVRANCCVYRGKWIYEIMLGSKGVMQLGWCTLNCRFSQEEGVGDTPDSYAYDGTRLRKWNVKTFKYGEAWLSGDVISCAIDLDNGTVEFFRNGHSMGIAFSNVKTGPGYAYFPAASLSMGENIHVNFGATPLRFPVPGYKPLQEPRWGEIRQAQALLRYLERLVSILLDDDKVAGFDARIAKADITQLPLAEQRTRISTAFLIAAHVFDKLGPLLKNLYIVEACLLPTLLQLSGGGVWHQSKPALLKMLDLFWALLQDFEVRQCMESLAAVLLASYRYTPVLPDFKNAKKFLALTVCILRHQRTRRYLLSSVLFDKLKFPVFMHIKPPDDSGLQDLIPEVWWPTSVKDDTENMLPDSTESLERKRKYISSCEKLRCTVEELEKMQVEMLKLLLLHNDVMEGKTSRDCFLEKFHILLKESSGITWVFHSHTCPLPVLLCFFHRLLQAVRFYWDMFQSEDPERFTFSGDAFVPIHMFWSDNRDAGEFQRCGGLMSHLNRTLGTEVNRAQGFEVRDDGKVVKMERKSARDAVGNEDYPAREMPSGNSIMELLDGLVLLYHAAAHKQLAKMWSLQDTMQDFVLALQDTKEKLRKCPKELIAVREDLERACQVFTEKVTELSRHMGWVISVVYSQSKQRDVEWLLRVVLRTLERASCYRQLFQYVPEYYIESCFSAFNALRSFFHPTQPFTELPNVEHLLQQYATFLVDHFGDTRIVSNDLRDKLVQALACFTCFRDTLTVLETLPMNKRLSMVQTLLAPYENRSWAHTNWILVRIWKGCGFANRYRYLPNLIPSKVQPTDFSFVSLQEPCPSRVFQSLLAKTLLDNETLSTAFLDSLMNQLNWSFSEFVGMMQEIQQMSSRSDNLLLEGRQVKICAACFEISACLLRVLEMVATVAPQLFTDWSRPSAELFLKRIMQLLSQIVMRVTMPDGAFETLVSLPIPGLDCVTYFPILTVTVGILVQLIVRCGGSSQEKAVRALLTDTGFQPSALDFVLGNASSQQKSDKKFSFRNYAEVNTEEIQDVELLISHLSNQQKLLSAQTQETDEENLCTICYANPQTAIFVPCHHRSCRTCITQQLLSKRECFFCKATIVAVQDAKGRPLLREHFTSTSPRK